MEAGCWPTAAVMAPSHQGPTTINCSQGNSGARTLAEPACDAPLSGVAGHARSIRCSSLSLPPRPAGPGPAASQ
jgi:hypothetical protein